MSARLRNLALEFDLHGEPGDVAGSARIARFNLSACPFCCSHDVEAKNTWTPFYWVECNGCGAEGPHVKTTARATFASEAAAKRGHRRAITAAIEAWEQRT